MISIKTRIIPRNTSKLTICKSLCKVIMQHTPQSAITCSKLTIETLGQGVKDVQS